MLPKPNAVETYLHDVDHMEDHELEAKYYTSGIAAPRYPMPAVRLTVEILPNRVVLWTRYNGRLDYQYLAMRG